MAFKMGDPVYIQIGKNTIKLEPAKVMELQEIVFDEKKEAALSYLTDTIYSGIKESITNTELPHETKELVDIVENKNPDPALRYLNDVVYSKAKAYMKKRGCSVDFL